MHNPDKLVGRLEEVIVRVCLSGLFIVRCDIVLVSGTVLEYLLADVTGNKILYHILTDKFCRK